MYQKEYLDPEVIERLKAIPKNTKLHVLLSYVSQTEDLAPEKMDEDGLRTYCQRRKEQLIPILEEKRIPYRDILSLFPMLPTELNPEQILDLDKNPFVEIQIDYPGIVKGARKTLY